jgi:hypothetical protein
MTPDDMVPMSDTILIDATPASTAMINELVDVLECAASRTLTENVA